jgi:molecular chaperone DnaJ
MTGVKLDVESSYSELGLTAQSTDAEIKAAWRRLSARWHPDRNTSPAALRKIQRINRALEEIRNSRRGGLSEAPASDDDADDDAQERGSREAHDTAWTEPALNHTVRLTLEVAVVGCVKDLQGEVVEDCAECGATGLHPKARQCRACSGSGQVRQPLWFIWMSSEATCSACRGTGTVRQACGPCHGSGKTPPRKYHYRVQIPPGIRDGDLLQSPAQRHTHGGKSREALCIRIELEPHEFFELEDDGTVKCEVPVDGFAWIANRWVEVPTPTGLQQMRLKRGHLGYRIKGQGFPTERSGPRADCIVTVVPVFPEEFSSKQEAQISRLIAANSGDPGTAAGKRVSVWNQRIEKWQAKLPSRPEDEQG